MFRKYTPVYKVVTTVSKMFAGAGERQADRWGLRLPGCHCGLARRDVSCYILFIGTLLGILRDFLVLVSVRKM